MSLLKKIENRLDALGALITQWWVWPSLMLVMGSIAVTAALVVYPGVGEQMMLFGRNFGSECGFKQQFGVGCAGCGMTRSWVYTIRGDVLRAMDYNAAGSLLFIFLAVGIPLGGIRLIFRKPNFLKVRLSVALAGVLGWLALAFVIFVTRIFGINPLP